MSIHLTSGRKKFSENDWCFAINPTTGNLTAGNYYFSIQGRNRVGLNEPLISNLIAVPTNSTLIITLKPSIYQSGENWFDFIISISQINNANSFKQILAINLKNNDDIFLPNLPLDIVLNNDFDLETDKEFCSVDDIDDSNFKNGKIIKLITNNFLYEFYQNIYLEENEISINQFNTDNGSFKRVLSSNKNITDTSNYGGCDLDIRGDLALLDYLRIPSYQINGTNSELLKFTVDNNSETNIPANSLISITSFINGVDGAGYLQNSIYVIYRGFVNLTTGVLRVTDEDDIPLNFIGLSQLYDSSNPNLFLPDVIKPNEGFVIDLYVNLNPLNLSNLFTNNSGLLLYPSVALDYIRYSPFYEIFTEGAIVNKPDYCFLDPQLDGNIVVKKGEFVFKGYSITRNFEEEYLLSNNAEQFLNLTTNGVIESYLTIETLPFNSVNIARIKCLAGKSKVSNKLTVTLSSNSTIKIKLALPVVDEKIKIRDNYSNLDLRNELITFPTEVLELYIKKPDNQIVKWDFITEPLDEQIIEIGTLPVTEIDAEDINLETDFGLINSPVISLEENTVGLIPAGTYEIYGSFVYTGLQVTDILDTLKIFDIKNLGTGTGQINYSIANINSVSNLLLNLQNSLNYEILLVGNCTLANVVSYQKGSTINILFRQDGTGNRVVTFEDKWKFPDSVSTLSLTPNSVTYLKGFVTDNGIYCSLEKVYDIENTPNDGMFGNDTQLNNNLVLIN